MKVPRTKRYVIQGETWTERWVDDESPELVLDGSSCWGTCDSTTHRIALSKDSLNYPARAGALALHERMHAVFQSYPDRWFERRKRESRRDWEERIVTAFADGLAATWRGKLRIEDM